MPKLQASWVHGTAVQMEREGYFISKRFTGGRAIFRTHGKEWFHFAIPTPVIVDSKRSSLKKIFVFFDTIGTAKITAIHVYDGFKRIKEIGNLNLSGQHYKKVVGKKNSWTITPFPPGHKMLWGLGVSVHVDFGPPTKLGVPGIQFFDAGADFVTP